MGLWMIFFEASGGLLDSELSLCEKNMFSFIEDNSKLKSLGISIG